MKFLDCESYTIVLIEKDDENLSEILTKYDESKLIYVALEGVETDELSADRFLVKNPDASFNNHMMWEGLLDEEEQLDYIFKCARRFYENGKQMVIEDYDFKEDEPFYDYSR